MEQLAWAYSASRLDDVDGIAKIVTAKTLAQLGKFLPDVGRLYGFLSKKSVLEWEEDGERVFVKCGAPADPAFLGAMWVQPEFRRRRVGASLVQHAFEFLRSSGQTELSLWVTRGHHGVFKFYQGLGFQTTGDTSTLRPGSDVVIDELRRALT